MDQPPTADGLDAFRQDVRARLRTPAVQTAFDTWRAADGPDPDERPLYRELGRQGLLAPDWPVEYGGGGLGRAEAAALYQELVRAGIPDTLHVNTVQIVGLFLLMAGTPEQKAAHLPAIAAGERFASVLYTEPETGSDLAALRTTAVRETGDDGDGWRLDGVKVFSLKSDRTHLGLCAARTGPADGRYHGISLFLVDLAADGVHRSVIPGLADEQFHRIDLRGVRVPAGALVGTEHQGWPLLTQALAVERTGLDYALKAERWYRAVLAHGIDRPEEVARYGAAVDAAGLFAARLTAGVAVPEDGGSGHPAEVDEPLSAAAKYYTSELAQSVAGWAAALGLPGTDTDDGLEAAYREAPGLTLSAGTSEVMLQVVAGAGALDPGDDLLQAQLRQAVRKLLNQAVADRTRPGVHEPPAEDGPGCPSWPALLELGAPLFEVPAEAGGLDLGLAAATVIAEELGRAALRGPYLDTAAALDLLGPDAVGAAAETACAGTPLPPPSGPPTGPAGARRRIRHAAHLVGLAAGATAEAVELSHRREQFGHPLAHWQGVALPLARHLTRIEAARLLVRRAAALADSAAPEATLTRVAAEALATAAETALEAVRTAVHTAGVRGLIDTTPLHLHYRLARTEAVRLGTPAALWHQAGLTRLTEDGGEEPF
ncbi:acyl-CoA dehydrogenase family protein [Kitasatospora sp. NPDC085879]|uniref:acyl-CoA dehydrogenase family protein n=1 Tax=Kitasatospora sp. NPDC085879 TaxID=3154769 RepID=UPI00343A6A52